MSEWRRRGAAFEWSSNRSTSPPGNRESAKSYKVKGGGERGEQGRGETNEGAWLQDDTKGGELTENGGGGAPLGFTIQVESRRWLKKSM